MSQRGALILFTFVLIVGALICGLFYIREKKSQTVPARTAETTALPASPSSTTIPASSTEGWKLYRNEKYGFEFKLPSDLINKMKVVYDSDGGICPTPPCEDTLRLELNVPSELGTNEHYATDLEVKVYGLVCNRPDLDKFGNLYEKPPFYLTPRIEDLKDGNYSIAIHHATPYECYDCSKQELDRSSYTAFLCSLNKTACIESSSKVSGSAELPNVYDFFVKKWLQTLKIINGNFENIPCVENTDKG